MLQVFYTRFTEKIPAERFNQLLDLLTPEMRQQVSRFRNWEDAHRSVLGKALLLEGLKQLNDKQASLSDLKFTDLQKPYFANGIHFNISHSGDFIVCAIGTMEMGIDIEEIKKIPLNDFAELFSSQELESIYKVPDDFTAFYTLWTQKEAFLKALGVGLNLPLNQVIIKGNTIIYQGSTWYLQQVDIQNGYICHIAFPLPNAKVNVTELHF